MSDDTFSQDHGGLSRPAVTPHALPVSLYSQLHALAERAMAGERENHSLQPSELLNEAWLRLAGQENVNPAEREHYLAAAAKTMRRVLVDHARRKQRQKRGGPTQPVVSLNAVTVNVVDESDRTKSALDVLALDQALSRLAQVHPRAARVVELRFFGSLANHQVAEHLEISVGTVHNDWNLAKAWLYRKFTRRTTSPVQ